MIDRDAPLWISINRDSGIRERSTTTCRLNRVEPSLRAMNATFLLIRLVLTQPLTVTCFPKSSDNRISLILVRFNSFIFNDLNLYCLQN